MENLSTSVTYQHLPWQQENCQLDTSKLISFERVIFFIVPSSPSRCCYEKKFFFFLSENTIRSKVRSVEKVSSLFRFQKSQIEMIFDSFST